MPASDSTFHDPADFFFPGANPAVDANAEPIEVSTGVFPADAELVTPTKTQLARRAARVPPRITLTVLANGYAWEPAPVRRRAFIEYDTKAKKWAWEIAPPRRANRPEGLRYGRTRSGTCKYLHQALGKIAARMNIEPTSASPEPPPSD